MINRKRAFSAAHFNISNGNVLIIKTGWDPLLQILVIILAVSMLAQPTMCIHNVNQAPVIIITIADWTQAEDKWAVPVK